MKNIRIISVYIIFTTGFHFGFSQSEYVKTDSIYRQGDVFLVNEKKVGFQLSKKDTIAFYSPEEANEFKYDGSIYQSLYISNDRRFYQLLTLGDVSLYKGKKSYVIKKQDSLLEFNRKNFRSVIREKITFMGKDRLLSGLSYTKTSLRNFVSQCNNGNGNSDKINFNKFGTLISYSPVTFNVQLENTINIIDHKNVVLVGLFGDFPFNSNNSLSLSTELSFFKSKPSFNSETPSSFNYIGIDLSGFVMPVSLKWFVGKRESSVNPYIKMGGVLSYFNVNSPTGFIKAKSNKSVIEISTSEFSNLNSLMYGFSSGVGIELNNGKRKRIHIELKYGAMIGSFSNSLRIGYSGFTFGIGYSI
ncbi:MAG: hypothetical protein ACKVOQ_13930 [Cyclobacteriaceae bacterium]